MKDEMKGLPITTCTSVHSSWAESEIFHYVKPPQYVNLYKHVLSETYLLKLRKCTALEGHPEDTMFP